MFAIIDSGTTNTRIYLADREGRIRASSTKKVGVRDVAMTGSPAVLREGIAALFQEVLSEAGIPEKEIDFAAASGMITSEIGLIELPHLTAPAGLEELRAGVYRAEPSEVLPLGCPVYFVRGVKNRCREPVSVGNLGEVDFMRGEEVQCLGILEALPIQVPCNIVVLSSHTKSIYIDAQRRIASSRTSLSGQLFEAISQATNIGKSLLSVPEELPSGYPPEQILSIAADCATHGGLVRSLLMPRFMQVLMRSTGEERRLFLDGAIAADDMRMFREMEEAGLLSRRLVLFGHETRCGIYTALLRRTFGDDLEIRAIHDEEEIRRITVRGVIAATAPQFNHVTEGGVSHV